MKRRDFLKFGLTASATGVTAGLVGGSVLSNRAYAAAANIGLADPAIQNMFTEIAINALAPNFKYRAKPGNIYNVGIQQAVQMTGLKNAAGNPLPTTIWGYSENGTQPTWPGKTFEVQSNQPVTVNWSNALTDTLGSPLPHILPVDKSLHWCYSLAGYEAIDIATDGVPLVPHLHGGHSDSPADGNPEYFFGTTVASRGPRWVSNSNVYDNSQTAGTLWYHDHALGITRLNVYAGLAGFYIVRDAMDTGNHNNPMTLPAKQYELAYAIQDRMFKDTGELFYPAFKGDPSWDAFITPAVNAKLPTPGGPSALAEFFGDHIVVNGKLWPKANVEPRNYRMRLLNGCDSRFMRLRFRQVPRPATDLKAASAPLNFTVVGTDQGLLRQSVTVTEIDFMPGERLDIVFNFASVRPGYRVIVENILGDAPFDGTTPAPQTLDPNRRTDRIMAFDVITPLNPNVPDRFTDFGPANPGSYKNITSAPVRVRKLGLYEGTDQYGRLMPLLGTAERVEDINGNIVNGSLSWGDPITENPNVGDTEIWEIFNATVDAHPIHLHLVHFEVYRRFKFGADLVPQPLITHDGGIGTGARLENINIGSTRNFTNSSRNNTSNNINGNNILDNSRAAKIGVLTTEEGPKDMVLCYPGEVTLIKVKFDKPGRFVWHCHILSHEDHEMMRPIQVGYGPY